MFKKNCESYRGSCLFIGKYVIIVTQRGSQ